MSKFLKALKVYKLIKTEPILVEYNANNVKYFIGSQPIMIIEKEGIKGHKKHTSISLNEALNIIEKSF